MVGPVASGARVVVPHLEGGVADLLLGRYVRVCDVCAQFEKNIYSVEGRPVSKL